MTEPLIPADLLTDAPFTEAHLDAYYAWMDAEAAGIEEDEDGIPYPEPHAARWSIDGPNTCAWAMARYAAAEAVIAEAAERRDAYVQRIMDAYENETRRAARDLQFFAGHLARFAIGERERTGDKVKTLHTPDGKITTTRHAAKAVVADEAAVLEWAEKHVPAAVKRSLLVTPIRDAVALVEVPTSVVMSCGCIVHPHPVDDDEPFAAWIDQWWTIGTGRTCPSCAADALVGQWRTVDLIPCGPDGMSVHGVDVEAEHVTAKVVAG